MKLASKFILLLVGLLLFFVLNLLLGTVKIPVDAILSILLGDESQQEIWRNFSVMPGLSIS